MGIFIVSSTIIPLICSLFIFKSPLIHSVCTHISQRTAYSQGHLKMITYQYAKFGGQTVYSKINCSSFYLRFLRDTLS